MSGVLTDPACGRCLHRTVLRGVQEGLPQAATLGLCPRLRQEKLLPGVQLLCREGTRAQGGGGAWGRRAGPRPLGGSRRPTTGSHAHVEPVSADRRVGQCRTALFSSPRRAAAPQPRMCSHASPAGLWPRSRPVSPPASPAKLRKRWNTVFSVNLDFPPKGGSNAGAPAGTVTVQCLRRAAGFSFSWEVSTPPWGCPGFPNCTPQASPAPAAWKTPHRHAEPRTPNAVWATGAAWGSVTSGSLGTGMAQS